MPFQYLNDGPQFLFFESVIVFQFHRIQPKLCRAIAFVNMNVRRFVSFLAEEEKFEPANSQNRWHIFNLRASIKSPLLSKCSPTPAAQTAASPNPSIGRNENAATSSAPR